VLATKVTGIQIRVAIANTNEIAFPETFRGERSMFINLQSILSGFAA